MNILADNLDHVIGVDPDRDRITVAIINTVTTGTLGKPRVFQADPTGYQAALAWANEHTTSSRRVWSIEGAGSYHA